MKLNLTDKDRRRLEQLIDQKYQNIAANDFYNAYLTDHYLDISAQTIRELTRNGGLKDEDAFYMALLLNQDISPEDDDVKALEATNQIQKVTCLNPNTYEKCSYTEMPIMARKEGHWELRYNYFEPYEGFLYDDVYADPKMNYAERNYLGFFTRKVSYLTVIQDGVVWMSITPHEINTMKDSLGKAKGNVLVYGLGLGYYALGAARKPEVSSVTIIENDPTVIDLFRKEILPKSRFAKKITIIQADAFDYTEKNIAKGHFDFVFFDIYHNAEDGIESYLKMSALESLSPETTYTYWIEKSLLSLLRRYLITLFEENLDGLTDEDYRHAESDTDRLINTLYRKTEDLSFDDFDVLYRFLSDESLRQFARTVYAKS